MRQHSDEHVDQHDDHARAVRAEHEFADELRQIVSLVDSEDVDRRQSVDGEVQRLNDLEQAAQMQSYIPPTPWVFSSVPPDPSFLPFPLFFPPRSGLSNPANGFGGALLAALAGENETGSHQTRSLGSK